jgi:hypothetical protein
VTQTTKSREELDYEEYLKTQKRSKSNRVHLEPLARSRREFVYSVDAIESAKKDRYRQIYSVKDMDDEFTAAPPSKINEKDLWQNSEVEASTDFDIDAPIPQRELRPIIRKNEFKLQEELSLLSKKLAHNTQHNHRKSENGDEDFVFRN